MSDKAEATEASRSVGAPKRGFFGALLAHFKRFWWLHFIIFVIVVLVITLPLIYVGYPKIAQDGINKSTLNVTAMIVSNPTSDSFDLELDQLITSSSIYHPQLDAFNATLTLAGASAPFLTLNVPQMQALATVRPSIKQHVTLGPSNHFTDYTTTMMLNKTVDVVIYGQTGLKEGPLPKNTVTYNKTVTMNGLNKLQGLNITSIQLVNPPVDGNNMKGNVFIPNPSVSTLTLGNVSLDLSVKGTPIGTSTLPDLVLRPGDNNVRMVSNINETYVISLITDPSSPFKASGTIPVDISSKGAVYNGQDLVYFSKALQANNLTVPLNVLGLLGSSSS